MQNPAQDSVDVLLSHATITVVRSMNMSACYGALHACLGIAVRDFVWFLQAAGDISAVSPTF